jgi:hypothetical protein
MFRSLIKSLDDFLTIIKYKLSEFKHVQDTFEKVKNWQEKYKSAPDNISRISELEKLIIQITLDTWVQ